MSLKSGVEKSRYEKSYSSKTDDGQKFVGKVSYFRNSSQQSIILRNCHSCINVFMFDYF